MLGKAPIEIARVILARWQQNDRWHENPLRNVYGERDLCRWLGLDIAAAWSANEFFVEEDLLHLHWRLRNVDMMEKLSEIAAFCERKQQIKEEPRWKKFWRHFAFNPRSIR